MRIVVDTGSRNNSLKIIWVKIIYFDQNNQKTISYFELTAFSKVLAERGVKLTNQSWLFDNESSVVI